MNLRILTAALALGVCTASADTEKWTLEEREYWTKLQEELDGWAKKTMDHCPNATISAKYVQETYRGKLTAGGNYGLDQMSRVRCQAAIMAAMEICTTSDAGKKAIAKGLHTIECSFGPTSYKLVKGNFKSATDGKSDQYDFYLRGMTAFLKKKL
jgi:hypothetical protein